MNLLFSTYQNDGSRHILDIKLSQVISEDRKGYKDEDSEVVSVREKLFWFNSKNLEYSLKFKDKLSDWLSYSLFSWWVPLIFNHNNLLFALT